MSARLTFPRTLITRDKEYDFWDDGNSFRGYLYKNALPISVCTYGDEAYVDIRLDRLVLMLDKLTSYLQLPLEDRRLGGKYNGVPKQELMDNMADFISICEQLYQKYFSPDFEPPKVVEVERECNTTIYGIPVGEIRKALERFADDDIVSIARAYSWGDFKALVYPRTTSGVYKQESTAVHVKEDRCPYTYMEHKIVLESEL